MAGTLNTAQVVRITAAANGVVATSFTATRSAAVTDVVLIATDGGATTVRLSTTGGNLSDAINMAGDTRVLRPAKAGVWTAANSTVVAGNLLTCTPGAAQAYEAYIYLYPTAGVAL